MDISEIIAELEKLDEISVKDGISHHFLEVMKTDREVTIHGNTQGLIYLALTCLALAEKKTEGSHQHFDEISMLDRSDIPVVIAYKSADWEKPEEV